jgi:hypothetical protein
MKIDVIDLSSPECLSYLERYVNDGSPSGFSDKFTTSDFTSPLGDTENFNIVEADIPDSFSVIRLGHPPDSLNKCGFLLHPDMANCRFWSAIEKRKGPSVTPTSSARTVRMIDKDLFYIKLSYDHIIGRTPRSIGKQQATSAIEVTSIISSAIDKKHLPNKFRFMREIYAEVICPDISSEKNDEWGYVIREPNPYPEKNDEIIIIPAFSLFSKDRKAPDDPYLIDQLIQRSEISPWDYVVNGLISPLIEAHFSLLTKCGLQLEPHAQNMLFSFDEFGHPKSVIARDAESIDKDLGIIESYRLSLIITETNYKLLKPEDYNYQIMHSFMFDFKLGEYLIAPLVSSLSRITGDTTEKINQEIRRITRPYLSNLPDDFFPSDHWFSYENIIHDRSKRRDYIKNMNPKYR